MEIYERIKHRRKELGLTADAVADALGVSRATVYRYESADIEKLPITAIKPLSEVLRISPAYLMGWEETTAAASAVSVDLTEREAEHIRRYRYISEEGRRRIDAALNLEYDMLAEQKVNVSSA